MRRAGAPRGGFLVRRVVAGVLLALGEFAGELPYAGADVVASGADLVDRPALGVGQVPVDVALARDERACVSAAHRDHDVCLLGEFARELLWAAV
jgi:hypothetical protein